MFGERRPLHLPRRSPPSPGASARPLRALWGAALAVGLGACAPGGEVEAPRGGLAEVNIPEGFDFATQQAVTLELAPAAALTDRVALLEVRLPEGQRIYTGPLAEGGALRLPLATRVTELSVTVRAGDYEATRLTPVQDGRAVVVLD